MHGLAERLLVIAAACRDAASRLHVGVPWVYHPLSYAWAVHEQYLRRYAATPKRVLFLGMNPGPHGMVQTGIPFGDVPSVRDWLGLDAPIAAPPRTHPRRPVLGWAYPRREPSGRRLWGLLAARFGSPEACFAEQLVVNWCPLAFFDADGANLTPERLPAAARRALEELCDAHLAAIIAATGCATVVALGAVAAAAARRVGAARVVPLPHPSPANPGANRGWADIAERTLREAGVWAP